MEQEVQQPADDQRATIHLESVAPKLDSFSVLFKESWQFFKVHFKSIFSFFFLLSLVPALTQLVLQYINQKAFFALGSGFGFLPIAILTGLIAFVINLGSQIINIGAVKKLADLESGVNDSVVVSSKKILKFAWPLLWATILTTIALMGGSVLLIVPGILFAISASFVSAVVVLENKKGTDAIVQSFWYAHGRRGQVFTRGLLLLLLLLACSLVVFVVLASIAIGILLLKFGGFEEGMKAVVFFVLQNAGNSYTPATGLFFAIVAVWSVVASALNAFFWGILYVFGYKLWQNAKRLQPETVPEEFTKKTKKLSKVFAWIGVVVIVVSFVFGFLNAVNKAKEQEAKQAEFNRMMMEQMQKQLDTKTK